MSEDTVLKESDYAANGKTWIDLAKKWGHYPDTEHISYHWNESGKPKLFTATVGEIKARAFDSLIARIPNHETKWGAKDAIYELRSRCLPLVSNIPAVHDFDKIEAFYNFLIEITE